MPRIAALPQRIPSLDGWRAISILLVLGSHIAFTSHVPTSWAHWSSIIFEGNLGVRIFFVISGFIITILLLREANSTGTINLRNFYARRIFRIFPVYFAYLAALGLLTLGGLYSDSLSSWLGCVTFTRNMVGRGNSGSAHFWSLAIEEQFYLLWPVILWRFHLWKKDLLYVGVLIIPILLCPFVRLLGAEGHFERGFWSKLIGPWSILNYGDSIAIGCLGAWLFGRKKATWHWSPKYSAGLLVATLFLFTGKWLIPTSPAISPTLDALATIACVQLSTHRGAFGYSFLNSKALVAIGMLSYSLYIWHFLFISHYMGPVFTEWPTHDWKFWLIPSVTTAMASYFYLERPFVKWRRKFDPSPKSNATG